LNKHKYIVKFNNKRGEINMETASGTTLDKLDEKMRIVLGNFTQLSQQASAIQTESAVFNDDINNLAYHLYAMRGNACPAERLPHLVTTKYVIEQIGTITKVSVQLVSTIDEYNQQIVFEINTETGDVTRTDVVYVETEKENGVVDRSLHFEPKKVSSPVDIISHMNADMYLMTRNHLALELGKTAS
jgi:hypothetical protein